MNMSDMNMMSTRDDRPIASINRAARVLMNYVSARTRPSGVRSGDVVVHDFDMTRKDGMDNTVIELSRLGAGKKLRYRNGRVEMHDMGDRSTLEPAKGNLLHLMMQVSGYLKLMDLNGYYSVDMFDLSVYDKSDSVSFIVTLYRA